MAKVRVKIERKSVLIEVFPRRGDCGPVFEEDPNAIPWRIPRRPGRPRKDDCVRRVAQLREASESWSAIHQTLNRELGLDLTEDAYRNLYKLRSKQPNARHGELYWVFLQRIKELQLRILKVAKRRGRPRNDQVRVDGRQMYREGNDWEQVKVKLDSKYGQYISSDSYRRLCSPAKPLVPWRKLDLNVIRAE